MPIIPAVGIGRTLAKGADHQTATRYPAVRQHRLLTCCRFAVIIPRTLPVPLHQPAGRRFGYWGVGT
jgi:hypothetical protein